MTWRQYWNLTFWFALVGGPLGLLGFLGVRFYNKFIEPKPKETKYACQIINENYRVNGYLYKSKNDALNDIEKYMIKEIVTKETFSTKIIDLQSDEKIYVIRYLNDSSLAKIKIIDEIQNDDTIYIKGWIPTILLHDSICSQASPRMR